MKSRILRIAILLLALAGAVYLGWQATSPTADAQTRAAAPGHEGGQEAHGREETGEHADEKAHGAEDKEESHAHGGEKGHDEAEPAGESRRVALTPQAAEAAGIDITEAKPATIQESITLTGRIILNANATAQVKARFPGVVRGVLKSAGEPVTKGEVLAKVESNDSLQIYSVTSPIAGIVLTRSTNIGDVAAEAPIFVIADLSTVWAEFHVFSRDLASVKISQPIHVKSTDGEADAVAKVDAILPVAEASSQTVVARATIDNASGYWRSGLVVQGSAVVAEREVAVAVALAALQRIEGDTIVFVAKGEGFEARTVKLGLRDDHFVEVLEGLKAGERYAAGNSFLLKAELGKSEAEHSH